MKRIMLTVAYDGSAYSGFQEQDNAPTIEGEINRCLKELLGEEIRVIGGSRTDAGVHALCNVAVFDTESRIPGEKIYGYGNPGKCQPVFIQDIARAGKLTNIKLSTINFRFRRKGYTDILPMCR